MIMIPMLVFMLIIALRFCLCFSSWFILMVLVVILPVLNTSWVMDIS